MRIGLIGAGYIASWHIAAINSLKDCRVTAICDADVNKARRLAESIGAQAYQSVSDLLAADVCDSVHVLLPPEAHAAVAMEAIQAKKHIFMEKPMCMTSDECRAVIAAAASHNVKVGVNHNFLCLPSVDKLDHAIQTRLVGPIDHLTVEWMLPLGQIKSGPFGSWLFAKPSNAFFDVAPHSLAFVAYLLGDVTDLAVHAYNRIELPGGVETYGRWQITGETAGGTGFTVAVLLTEGFPQRRVEVRGFGARATVSFDRDLFTLERYSRHEIIAEPFFSARSFTRQIRRDAWRNLFTQAKSLDKLSPFGLSIRSSVNRFYSTLQGEQDRRISGEMGLKVIELLERSIAATEYVSAPRAPKQVYGSTSTAPPQPTLGANKASVLVLGGTGFIGRHLVKQLAADGHRVRVLSRGSCVELDGYKNRVEVVRGSMSKEVLSSAVAGVDCVYHLARPVEARTWNDYVTGDIAMTRLVGEVCCESSIRSLIYTGTIDSYYSGGSNEISEKTGLDPAIGRRNLYARSKAECENVLREMHRERGLPLVIARPGIVIGSGGNPLHPGVGKWQSPTVCLLWGDGKNKLPFVLVEDVATALARMIDVPSVIGEDYNLVGDPLLDAREYIAAYESQLNCKVGVHPHAIWRYYLWDCCKIVLKKVFGRDDGRPPNYFDWRSRSYAATYVNTKAKEHLNWQPTCEVNVLIGRGIKAPVCEYFQSTGC